MKACFTLCCCLALLTASARSRAGALQDRIIAGAEQHLGKPYVLGGRDGRKECRRRGKPVACLPGIDCQSLIFFALEQATGKAWRSFSVMPSLSVRREEWGRPVPGLSGVLRADLRQAELRKGDALFFLLQDYNLEADPPLWRKGQARYGVWHTGLVHRVEAGQAFVIHAKPGSEVLVEPLRQVAFEALFVVRLPEEASPRKNNESHEGPAAGSRREGVPAARP